jgi:hypothetical protein
MTAPAPIHKTCWTCDTPKPVTAFHWRNRARGVRHSSCKACRCEDERTRYNEREFDRIYLGGAGPRPLPAIAPTNPLPWGYGMTPGDVAAVNEAAEGARHIPATTPAGVVDPADTESFTKQSGRKCIHEYSRPPTDDPFFRDPFQREADPDPMGDGSAWGWVTVATLGALVALVAIVAWVAV